MSVQVRESTQELSNYIFTANIYREDDDYVAECAELGTVSQGRSYEEAIDKLKEATRLYLQSAPAATIIPEEQRADLIAGVRELEAAYAQELDEPITPANINLIGTAKFTIEPTYA